MYMSQDEIRARSRRIPVIVDATPEELDYWMQDALDVITNFCQQDFLYEPRATKRARATTNTLVYLPKPITGDVLIKTDFGQEIFDSTVAKRTRYVELFPGTFTIGWFRYRFRYTYPDARMTNPNYDPDYRYITPTAFPMDVTADWGYIDSKEELLKRGINELVASYEAHRSNTDVHVVADTTNAVVLPEATLEMMTMITRLNELRIRIISHFGDTTSHQVADDKVPTAAQCSDLDSAIVLLKDLKEKFNEHLKRGGDLTTAHVKRDEDNKSFINLDFENAIMPRAIKRVFLRIVQRVALRDDAEDYRQINSPYSNETLGDGYTYDLSNGTLRNLIRPEEAHMLLPYVNRGRVII